MAIHLEYQEGSRSKDFSTTRAILPLRRNHGKYPPFLRLSQDWHRDLDLMRGLTDVRFKEQFTPIGVNNNGGYTLPFEGSLAMVPSNVINKAGSFFRENGMRIIGDIHSHPTIPLLELGLRPIFTRLGLGTGTFFSVTDVYNLVASNMSVIGVVSGNENYFIFKTAETDSVFDYWGNTNFAALTYRDFINYWFAKHWRLYIGSSSLTGELSIPSVPWASSVTGVVKDIIQEFKLVSYKGIQGRVLKREFPRITS